LIKSKLNKSDIAYPITAIAEILKSTNKLFSIISDVGNHEYWLCRALALNRSINPTFFSKSYGFLGSSIGKSIGAFYGSLKPVVCFIGDQGLQMSIQELQFISKNKLPITIVLLNNFSSGMIRSREKVKFGKDFYPLHTTTDSGYSVPDFCSIANAYGINSYSFDEINYSKAIEVLLMDNYPKLIEFKIDSSIELIPFTPKNNEIKEMHPPIEDDLIKSLESL
jgi:acetolactate synthase-1/2/3 large subunit